MIPKFRAWYTPFGGSVKQFNKMKHGSAGSLLTHAEMSPDDYKIMQSTGLKDKNVVEIFEGDILKCTSGIYTNLGATGTGEYEETIKQVIWKDDSWGTRVISSNLTSKGAEKSGLVISAKYAEVLGNIYENPELLEEIK
ncbi:YopX family protein [Enterococcus viikkiensis]|uniref:YopX family protein n=1 Tax=Enterococcus viikkiensis TaxID=930854 RepID=UPI0010F98C04|nr:YopX family protein [Enterococcus viikkiensis]